MFALANAASAGLAAGTSFQESGPPPRASRGAHTAMTAPPPRRRRAADSRRRRPVTPSRSRTNKTVSPRSRPLTSAERVTHAVDQCWPSQVTPRRTFDRGSAHYAARRFSRSGAIPAATSQGHFLDTGHELTAVGRGHRALSDRRRARWTAALVRRPFYNRDTSRPRPERPHPPLLRRRAP